METCWKRLEAASRGDLAAQEGRIKRKGRRVRNPQRWATGSRARSLGDLRDWLQASARGPANGLFKPFQQSCNLARLDIWLNLAISRSRANTVCIGFARLDASRNLMFVVIYPL